MTVYRAIKEERGVTEKTSLMSDAAKKFGIFALLLLSTAMFAQLAHSTIAALRACEYQQDGHADSY